MFLPFVDALLRHPDFLHVFFLSLLAPSPKFFLSLFLSLCVCGWPVSLGDYDDDDDDAGALAPAGARSDKGGLHAGGDPSPSASRGAHGIGARTRGRERGAAPSARSAAKHKVRRVFQRQL